MPMRAAITALSLLIMAVVSLLPMTRMSCCAETDIAIPSIAIKKNKVFLIKCGLKG